MDESTADRLLGDGRHALPTPKVGSYSKLSDRRQTPGTPGRLLFRCGVLTKGLQSTSFSLLTPDLCGGSPQPRVPRCLYDQTSMSLQIAGHQWDELALNPSISQCSGTMAFSDLSLVLLLVHILLRTLCLKPSVQPHVFDLGNHQFLFTSFKSEHTLLQGPHPRQGILVPRSPQGVDLINHIN